MVDRVLAVVFGGDDDDSVNSAAPATVRPADDDGFEELLDFLEEVLLSDDLLEGVTDNDAIDGVEEVLDSVGDSVEVVVCVVDRVFNKPTTPIPCA